MLYLLTKVLKNRFSWRSSSYLAIFCTAATISRAHAHKLALRRTRISSGAALNMQSRAFSRWLTNNFAISAVKMSTNAFLFPGQGSQYVGMTEKHSSRPAVDHIFRTAEYVLDYDLHSVCLSGPENRLEETVVCQPAVMAASLAAAESLKKDKPQVIFLNFPPLRAPQ